MIHRPHESNPFEHSRSPLIQITPQPDFPSVDISDHNAEIFTYVLNNDSGSEAHALHLEDAQQHIHQIATYALRISGLNPVYSRDEYRSFTQGFSVFEALSDTLRAAPATNKNVIIGTTYDTQTAMQRTRELFLSEPIDELTEIDGELICTTEQEREQIVQRGNPKARVVLASKFMSWAAERPNTYDIIVDTAPAKSDPSNINARIMGAQIAYEFQIQPELVRTA